MVQFYRVVGLVGGMSSSMMEQTEAVSGEAQKEQGAVMVRRKGKGKKEEGRKSGTLFSFTAYHGVGSKVPELP
jgi:hypothetical protein